MNRRLLTTLLLCVAMAQLALAQAPEWEPTYIDEPGVCEGGVICGPSGNFTAETFPTVADIDWEAFPANPSRPYGPAEGGRVWHVAPGGDDDATGDTDAPLATVERAVELAGTDDVILVADGVYPVGVYEDSIIMDTPGVTLAAEHVGGAVLTPVSEEWAWLSGIVASADNLVIDGFVIRDFSRGYGVYFGRLDSPQRNLVLRHLWIEGVEDAIRSAIPDSGATHRQPVIEGLLLYDVAVRRALIGFNCGEGPCKSMRVEALSIDLTSDAATDVGSWGDGVAVENGEHVVVFNAEVTGAGADGIDLKATRVVVANVHVHDVQRNGVKLWRDGDVINALVYNTGADAAIVFDAGGQYRILNSVVARHAYGGQAYAGSVAYDNPEEAGSLSVVNSVFYQNAGALWVAGAFALDVRATLFYGSGNGQELIWARPEGEIAIGEADRAFSALEAAGGGGYGFDFVDPGFLNPDAGDYHLAAEAFARDRGLGDVGALPPFDLEGRPRVAGAAVDLGPYEG